MSVPQPPMPPGYDRELAPQPGALPPYLYAPPSERAPQPQPPPSPQNAAATASLVLAIVSLAPGWFSTALVPALGRSGSSAAQIGAVVGGLSLVSALIAVVAIICGHTGWNGSRAGATRPGSTIAVIGLTLGYSHVVGALISFLSGLLIAGVLR